MSAAKACGAAAAVAAAIAVWLYFTPELRLRDELRAIQFWQLEALLVLLVAVSIAGMRALLGSLAIARRELAPPLASSLLAAVLVFAVAPGTNRIYYDEQIYQSIGQNMADLRLAQMCSEGIVEYGVLQCARGDYNKEPYGFPHLLSVAYRIVGVSPGAAHVLNGLSAIALVWIIYLITVTLFGDRRSAALASLVAALIPAHLQWSHTAASEPVSAAVAAWAVLALAAFLRRGSVSALLWTVVAASYAMQFRPEVALIFGVVVAGVILLGPQRRSLPGRMWWALSLTFVLCAVAVAHVIAIRHESWGSPGGGPLSLAYLWSNLQVNGPFYFWDARFPSLVGVLAVVGAWARRSRESLLIGLWFLSFFGIYLLFYAGSYNYGADIRYSLLTYPPLMILAGVGAAAIAGWLERRTPFRGGPVIAAALLFQFTWYLPNVRAVGEEAWAARADVKYAELMVKQLPPNAIVLTHNPGMFQVWGVNAAQLSIAATEPDYVNVLMRRFAGGVFVHWNFWCNVSDPVQSEYCRETERRYDTEKISEYRERDYRYALSRIVGVKAQPLK